MAARQGAVSLAPAEGFHTGIIQNDPGIYGDHLPRPITAAGLALIGPLDNGANCGRWVHITIDLFELDGVPVGGMFPNFLQNGQISWNFEESPITRATSTSAS